MSEGCTLERHQHSKISLDKRTLTEGGLVLEYGNRDLEHCFLDVMLNKGLLGIEPDSRTRYDTGYKLRELYFSFKVSGSNQGTGGKSLFTSEAEIGNENDLAETKYNHVMRALPERYRRIIRFVCLEEVVGAPGDDTGLLIREGLDALYGSFRRVEK